MSFAIFYISGFKGESGLSITSQAQNAFSKVEGIVIDTHVIRLARRLGWSEEKDPARIERDLMEIFDDKEWRWIPFYLKNHGRAVCKAPTPKCGECDIAVICPSALIEPPEGATQKPRRAENRGDRTARRAKRNAKRKTKHAKRKRSS